MHVSRAWIEWAHTPNTECADAQTKYPASWELVARAERLPKSCRSVIVQGPEDEHLIRELLSVAECYGPGSATDEMGPWWRGYRNKVIRECRKELADASRNLPQPAAHV